MAGAQTKEQLPSSYLPSASPRSSSRPPLNPDAVDWVATLMWQLVARVSTAPKPQNRDHGSLKSGPQKYYQGKATNQDSMAPLTSGTSGTTHIDL
eukprot:gene1424-32795_t